MAFSFGPKRFLGKDAPGAAVAKQFMGNVVAVEAVDDYTVRVKTDAPAPLIVHRLAISMGGCICRKGFEAANSWEDWNKKPIGTGPYKVAEFKPGEYIRLASHDEYWGKKAPAKSVTQKKVPEMAARIAGLLAGGFHIITEIMPDQFTTIEKSDNAEVVGGPINNIRVILYDKMAGPVLKNVKIRRAMNYAIDRKLLLDAIFDGHTGVPKSLQMSDFGNLYISGFNNVTYDPDKAKALLKEAGYKCEEISYPYLKDYYTGDATAQILAEMWRQVGLNVNLELKENLDQIETDGVREGRAIVNWSNTAVFPDPLSQLYRIYGPDGFFQRRNMWTNAESNKWGEQLKGMDPAKRREAMENMLRIYEYDDPTGTYLYYLSQFYGKSKAVK